MFNRLVVLILSCTVLFTMFASGCANSARGGIDEMIELSPLTSEGDKILADNPDRGYRTEFCIFFSKTKKPGVKYDSRTVFVDQGDAHIKDKIESIFRIYIYNKAEHAKLSLAYLYIPEYNRDSELSPQLLNAFKIYFELCREHKIKNMLRVTYCTSTANLHEGADQKTIIRHVKQLGEFITPYVDTIHTISTGFVGAYGEWASVYQYPEVDYATVIKAITEHMAVPHGLFFSIRSPSYKNLVGADYEHYWSISHNNDAMFGLQTKGWNSGDYEVGTPDWEQVTREGAYTPQGGEMFVNGNMISTGRTPSGMEILLECYVHRHTSMSFWHGYLDAYKEDNVMKRWQENETITSDMLTANGVIHDPNWFLDKNGNTVERNPYEFIRDHLGYRLVGENAKINWSGNSEDKISVELNFKNYGFAAAFNMHSGFAILDENYNVVSAVAAGDPHTWYNRDPDNAASTEVLNHTVSAELDPVTKKGTYHIAFYLKNTMDTYAAISNDIGHENGFNILYTFKY